MADHGKELSEKARQFTGSRAKTSEKFDVKKFVDAFSGGAALGSPSERAKLATQRAGRVVAAVEGIQKTTGFSKVQAVNVLKGLSVLGKQGISREKLERITKKQGLPRSEKSTKFFTQVAQLGTGKRESVSAFDAFDRPKLTVKSFFDPRPHGPLSLEGIIPKPPKPKPGVLGFKVVSSLLKKIF